MSIRILQVYMYWMTFQVFFYKVRFVQEEWRKLVQSWYADIALLNVSQQPSKDAPKCIPGLQIIWNMRKDVQQALEE